MRSRAMITFLLCSLAAVGCTEDPYESATGDAPPNAGVRVVNEVEDAPFIDFCVKGNGPWLGPVVHTIVNDRDGLAFEAATGYLSIAGGDYTARLADPELGLCFPAISGDFAFTLESNVRYTATLTGKFEPAEGEEPLALTMHED